MEEFLLKFIIVVILAPWWYPAVRDFVNTVWHVSEEIPAPETGRVERNVPTHAERMRTRQAVWSNDGAGWSRRRIVNPAWDTGRDLHTAAKKGAHAGAFANRRTSERGKRRMGPSRFEGGFGRR